MSRTKLIPKPKKEDKEIEKDGRGNSIPPAGVQRINTVRRRRS